METGRLGRLVSLNVGAPSFCVSVRWSLAWTRRLRNFCPRAVRLCRRPSTPSHRTLILWSTKPSRTPWSTPSSTRLPGGWKSALPVSCQLVGRPVSPGIYMSYPDTFSVSTEKTKSDCNSATRKLEVWVRDDTERHSGKCWEITSWRRRGRLCKS